MCPPQYKTLFVSRSVGMNIWTSYGAEQQAYSQATIAVISLPAPGEVGFCATVAEDQGSAVYGAVISSFTTVVKLDGTVLGLCNDQGGVCLIFSSAAALQNFAGAANITLPTNEQGKDLDSSNASIVDSVDDDMLASGLSELSMSDFTDAGDFEESGELEADWDIIDL